MANQHVLIPALARILPEPFRKRVFEPAFADLMVEEAGAQGERRGAVGRLANRILFLMSCFRLGVPQIFWYRGRPTRLTGRVVAALAVLILVAVFISTRISYDQVAAR